MATQILTHDIVGAWVLEARMLRAHRPLLSIWPFLSILPVLALQPILTRLYPLLVASAAFPITRESVLPLLSVAALSVAALSVAALSVAALSVAALPVAALPVAALPVVAMTIAIAVLLGMLLMRRLVILRLRVAGLPVGALPASSSICETRQLRLHLVAVVAVVGMPKFSCQSGHGSRPMRRSIARAFRQLGSHNDAIIMFCMLQVIFSHDRVARRLSVTGKRHVFLSYVSSITSDLHTGTVALEITSEWVLAAPIIVTLVVLIIVIVAIIIIATTTIAAIATVAVAAAASAVLLSLPHRAPISHLQFFN